MASPTIIVRQTQRRVRLVGAYTLAVFGAASLCWVRELDAGQPVGTEIARFMMVGIIVAGVVALTGRLRGMRERSRKQRAALSTVLERIREHAVRDELTGCFNRHAMLAWRRPGSGESIVDTIERADKALCRAKHDGRNRRVCA